MPTLGDETARLSDLHDAYIWEVNAAIGEGREDLLAALEEDYLAEAMREMVRDRGRNSRSGGFPVAVAAKSPPDRLRLKTFRWIGRIGRRQGERPTTHREL